jgi:hypothetical protein
VFARIAALDREEAELRPPMLKKESEAEAEVIRLKSALQTAESRRFAAIMPRLEFDRRVAHERGDLRYALERNADPVISEVVEHLRELRIQVARRAPKTQRMMVSLFGEEHHWLDVDVNFQERQGQVAEIDAAIAEVKKLRFADYEGQRLAEKIESIVRKYDRR